MKYFVNCCKIFIFVLQLIAATSAEFYSSTAGLEQLYKTEVILLDELQVYVNEITQHVQALQSEIDAIRMEHLSAGEGIESYLTNPVNAFRLIKRLHSDWETFEGTVEGDTSRTNYLEAMAGHRQNLSFPTQDDFVGTAIALTRLQKTYQLDAAELASGMLNGVKYGTAMSWQDCFVLGQHLYALRDYNHTVPWLEQSMQLLIRQSYAEESASLDFMEAVMSYYQQMGDYENALSLVNYVLAVQPERLHLMEMRSELEHLITDGVKQGLLHETLRAPGDYHSSHEFRLYEQVCRGETRPSAKSQRELRCRLQRSRLSYEVLELEELHQDPFVVQVHNIVSQKDMNLLQKIARPNIQRSQVYAQDHNANETVAAAYRTSKGATFEYFEHRSMELLSRHVADLSGLDMNSAELLQIANYGIGGHYEPHWDCFPDHHVYLPDDRDGNRIATGIYYLSEVEAGGGTAFPFLPLLVTPERGSLVFWYNLHRSGDQDYRTKHAACPVLQGSKWIANVWIRQSNQDQIRPCGLQRDNEVSLPFKEFQ
ncbi:uncharacterized protein Dwil_GK13125 [Drosophila willistoni]|uniref:procollagen-proline 4-dioxygenase n=1 Tax=Drosophila willistoni TaxID=7260 RepID=B4NGW4_DROWI|nr:prolyl 4-hydroxylase subunit alpha-2 [Drosophila willistoni]EDW84461.1 uncharacterized protein Dwil_GK13125 [Drosophila willistoni]